MSIVYCVCVCMCIYVFVCMCVCSPKYLTCNADAPYCHPWPAQFYNIFLRSLIHGTILEKHTHTHTHTHIYIYILNMGIAVVQWLRCCATNRKVAG